MSNNSNKNEKNQNQGNGGGSENMNENERKMIKVEKQSAMPIISFGLCFVLLSIITRMRNPTTLVLVFALSFVVYQIVKSKFPPKSIEICMEDEEEPAAETVSEEIIKANNAKNPELREINSRITMYEVEIMMFKKFISDEFITGELNEIESLLKKIQAQINDENKPNLSKKIEQVSDFFDYYMPTTIKILNSYRKIEEQNLTGENAAATKKRVEETLPLIRKAFAKELDNMFSDEMLDITTDIDVLEAMLSKDGLIDKDGNNLRNFDV